MGKKKQKQSFLDALLGSFKFDFKKSTKSNEDDFYNEEGKFEEFQEIKGAKKYSNQIVEGEEEIESVEETKTTKKKKKVVKQKKGQQEDSDFFVEEEANGFEEVEYEDDTWLGKIKKNIKFVIIISALIILLIVVLIVQSCTIKPGKLTGVEVEIPSVIYLDEQTKISARAIGKRNLSQTKYQFEVTNESIVELEAKGQLRGRRVSNTMIPLTTGKFAIITKSELGTTKMKDVVTQVTICKKLAEKSLSTEDGIIVEMDKEDIRLNLDIGLENECYQALQYKIADTSIVSIDELGYFIAKKEGDTTITITDGKTTITEDVHVKEKEDLTRVAGIKLDKAVMEINVGATEQITATITPDTATNKNIKWSSNNEGIVSVSNKGLIKGIGQGTAIITAETEDNKHQALVIVTVKKEEQPLDTTAPVLTKVNIVSSNSIPTDAVSGDKITLYVESNETLGTKPSMYIGGTAIQVSCDSTMKRCDGIFTVTDTTPKGKVSFKIISYKDTSGNTGTEVATTTDNSSVTIFELTDWSDLTETPCDTKNSNVCKTVTDYLKKETRSSYSYNTYDCVVVGHGCNGATGDCASVDSCPSGYSDVGWYTAGPSCCRFATGYTKWTFNSYTKTCTANNTTQCTAVTLYQSRTKK